MWTSSATRNAVGGSQERFTSASGTDWGWLGSGSNRRAVTCSPQKSPGRASIRAKTS